MHVLSIFIMHVIPMFAQRIIRLMIQFLSMTNMYIVSVFLVFESSNLHILITSQIQRDQFQYLDITSSEIYSTM
jgi:hypothetical protein